ncbi:unnamed protein product [Callosobruchus maculatus]|uniref:THAP-type domain-containing protein n=1 Tax=Callosobruchus maculatus TaxID=64391 RepID=A0A653D700_CALMS|nr:unnamed protein product [Callosobruchus maculatus]
MDEAVHSTLCDCIYCIEYCRYDIHLHQRQSSWDLGQFPKERRLKNVWIATLDLSKEQVKNLTIESVICSKHFKDSDFFETPYLECFRGDIEKAKLCWKIVEIIKANNRKRLHTLHQTNRRLRSRLHKWTNVWKQLENQNIEERRLKNVWIATLDLSKEQVKNLTIESVICSKHFKDSDFFETP